MRLRLTTILAAVVLAPVLARADRLDEARGKARPIVVLSDSRDDPRVGRQIRALAGTGAELTDRDVRVLREVGPDGPLRRKLGVGKGFVVVLVGKDGTVKKVWRDPVDPKTIFTIIDAMPMRRKERNG